LVAIRSAQLMSSASRGPGMAIRDPVRSHRKQVSPWRRRRGLTVQSPSTSAGITWPRSRRPACAPTPTCRGSSPASLEVAPARWVDATAGIRHCSGPLEKNWGIPSADPPQFSPADPRRCSAGEGANMLQTPGDHNVAADGATGSPEVLQYRFHLRPDPHPRGRLQGPRRLRYSSGWGVGCPQYQESGTNASMLAQAPIGRIRWARTLESGVPCPCRPGGVSLSHSRSPSPRRRCASWARSTAVDAA
jgi:hypothetical protein